MAGEELVHRRRRLRGTQDQLAAYLGVSKAFVWRWEHGQAEIPVPVQTLLNRAEQLPSNQWTAAITRASGKPPAGAGRWP